MTLKPKTKDHVPMSKDIILKAENISKQYRLGTVGTGTLSHDLNRWWHRVRGKEDPYLKVGDVNDRSQAAESNYVWALKDINFEIQRGEVLGIIGKNGAGKSTLLKILSRVTSPTTGVIKAKGRIASLLEVGTGFHPEMTGRENIYLNGAILGMTKAEIKRKEDEIIDFSGCARYIDTPVKRYSSGMRVRLAFAVAAFLEPDILVVDEVLAVGDAEFQKKAVGKMQDISKGEGRTVLFVSHNMVAVKSLCTRAILLDNGLIVKEGQTDDIVEDYLKLSSSSSNNGKYIFDSTNKRVQFDSIYVHDDKGEFKDDFSFDDNINFLITVTSRQDIKNFAMAMHIKSNHDNLIMSSFSLDTCDIAEIAPGKHNYKVKLPKKFLNVGSYMLDFIAFNPGTEIIAKVERIVINISVADMKGKALLNRRGYILKELQWSYETIDQ